MAFIRSDSTAVDVSASAPFATNYIDMLLKLIEFLRNENDSVQSFSAVAGGGTSGYAVGDILELDDNAATETFPSVLANCRATFEVTSVSTGVVTGLRIRNSGCYATLPTNNGTPNEFNTNILSGAGVGEVRIGGVVFDGNGWTVTRITQEIDTVAVDTAGTGYAAANVVTVVGGDTRVGFDSPRTATPGTITISTIGGGGSVATIAVANRGIYHRNPGTNSIATTGGAGTGFRADLTFRDFTDTTTDREVILTSDSGCILGLRTFNNGTVFNWELAGIPAYVAANDWEAQPNISVGGYDLDVAASYCVLENASFNFFLNADERGLSLVYNLAPGIYGNVEAGFMNPYGTTTEYAAPMLIVGCSSRHNFTQTSNAAGWLGMNGAVAEAQADFGPGQVYSPGGIWFKVQNGFRSTNDILGNQTATHLIPGGWHDPQSTLIAVEDRIAGGSTGLGEKDDAETFFSVATATGASGADAPTKRFRPTPGTTPDPDRVTLFEVQCVGIEAGTQAFGELRAVKGVEQELSGSTTLTSEDTLVDETGQLWYVFNNCRQTNRQHYFALRGA